MATIQNIRQRAQQLAAKWQKLSISPEEVGLLIDDLAALTNDAVINGSSLGIRKTYASVAAMQADKTSPNDQWGEPLKRGQLVSIASSDADAGKIYMFTDPNWAYVTTVDARYVTADALDEVNNKLTELGNKANSVGYAVCQTNGSTAAKTITVDGITEITSNLRLLVQMNFANTAGGSVTLNINGLGAKTLYYNGATVSAVNTWETGEIVELYYANGAFQCFNAKGGSGSGGNMILDWKSDVATTRKQVKAKYRKEGLIIAYKKDDTTWINEQYVGTSFTDTKWSSDQYWLKMAHVKDVTNAIENIDINTSFYIVDDTIGNASTYIPLNRRKQNQIVQFRERLKKTIIITIDGTATSAGDITITYNGTPNVVSIASDETFEDILTKIVALSIDGLTISKIGNNAYMSVADYDDTLTASYSTKATGISINIRGARTSDMYIYRLYKYTYDRLDDRYYNSSSNWSVLSVISPNPLYYSNYGWDESKALYTALIAFNINSDSSCDIVISSGNKRVYNKNGVNAFYLNFGGVRLNIPLGYALCLHYNGLIDIIKTTSDSIYPVAYLVYNRDNELEPSGMLVDFWNKKKEQEAYSKIVLLAENRLKCTYNTDGSLTIDRLDDGTYSGHIYTSFGNPVIGMKVRLVWPIQVPIYTALVYNISTNKLIERKYSVTNNPRYHDIPVASNEILLVANSVGRIQGGVLMPYIFNSRFYMVDRKLLPTPKRMHKGGPSQGMFIYGQNLCLCNASSDDHSSFVNNSIINKDTFSYIKTVQHNFGHLNTVNYNASNDCLMFSDSAKAVFPNHIYIIPNWSTYAASHDKWDFNEVEKVVIDVEWLYTELNEHKANPAWGPNWGDNDLIYVASKNNTVLRCLRLGKGTNQLDRGAYTPAEEDGYNGTYTVVNTYTAEQTICVNGDSHIINGCFVTGARFGTEGKSGILALRIQDKNSIKPELWQIDQAMGDGQGLATTEDEFFFATDSYIYVWDLAKFTL